MMTMIKNLMIATLLLPTLASASLIYDDWVSESGDPANYIITVDDMGDFFAVTVTVNPWDAEALALFIDLGDIDITDTTLQNESPSGQVSVYDTDTASNDCGSGCNLNGLIVPLADPDSEWEWVITLGTSGFDDIQTFYFEIADNGASLDDWAVVGIRAQQQCSDGLLLPGDVEQCDGSDKSYGTTTTTTSVPEPGTLALLGLGLLGFGLRRRLR